MAFGGDDYDNADVRERNLHEFSTDDDIVRPTKSRDYSRVYRHSGTPIVIDNGSYHCRVGWANEKNPRYAFRNLLSKPRTKSNGQVVNIVGDYDSSVLKSFDFSRSSVRSAFDSNVVFNFETMEAILDYGLDRLGVSGRSVEHPLFITECPCNPLQSRSKMAELVFEAYGVPSLAFGIDSVLSHSYNQQRGQFLQDGLLVSAGYSTTHVIPMLGGEPLLEAACRLPVGGYHSTDFLKRLLTLHYPQHIAALTWEHVEEMKQKHCYVAENYSEELKKFQEGGDEAEKRTEVWQLPWTPAPESAEESPDRAAKKAAMKERSGQRLREMAAARRASKIEELQDQVTKIEQFLADLDESSRSEAAEMLDSSGFESVEEVSIFLSKQKIALKKARGETIEEEPEEEIPDSEKYPLLDVPDKDLTAEQLKEKKRQRTLKNAADGRARAKQKRDEEKAKEQKERLAEEERRRLDPEAYLEEMQAKYRALQEKREQRKRKRLNPGSASAAVPITSTSLGGRGERVTAAHRERMRLLTTAAFDASGKADENFGAKESDWTVYKQMGREEDEEEVEAEEAEFARMTARLKEIDPNFAAEGSSAVESGQHVAATHRPTEEDYQIPLGVERFRASEILFQPSMVAIDRAGTGEMLAAALRRSMAGGRGRIGNGKVYLTGGNSLLEGLDVRLFHEYRKIKAIGSEISIVRAYDPLLDAWRGAAKFAISDRFEEMKLTRADYEEHGPDFLRKYSIKYSQ